MRSPSLFALALVAAAFAAWPNEAIAAWPHDPANGGVMVCGAANSQRSAEIVSDGAGGAIIVWADQRGGATSDIYAQRVGANGAPLWAPNGVAICTATGLQDVPVLVSDGTGGALIAWQDARGGVTNDIYAQRINASGLVQWAAGGVAVCTAANEQTAPAMTADGAGGCILAWIDLRSGLNLDLYAQRLNGAGVSQWAANGVTVCTATADQLVQGVTSDGAGGAIIGWQDLRAGSSDVYVQRVNAAGTPQWTANGVVLCSAANYQGNLQITSDAAGGAIVAWNDLRSATTYDIYVQRVAANGSTLWASDGLAVCTAANHQLNPTLDTDGSGGAIVAWQDDRSNSYDIYAQRVGANGAAQWTADGVPLTAAAADQSNPHAISDGAGGVVVAWDDMRTLLAPDVYGQRVSGTGAIQWAANGAALSTAANSQGTAALVSDGSGGAVVAWEDRRNANQIDIVAQRIERYGQLGNPEPTIQSVSDVRNDQGGLMKLTWNASFLDADPTYGISEYRVFRSVPGSFALGEAQRRGTTTESDVAAREGRLLLRPNAVGVTSWEFVGSQAAEAFATYSRVVATTADSVGGNNPPTWFLVEARASSSISSDRWSSAPDSGYSVDNLPPAAPAPLTGQYAAGTTALHWSRNVEADLAGYRLYRGGNASFVPGPASLVAALPDTGYTDTAGAPYVYKLTAIDAHGNESPVATLIPNGTLGVDDAMRALAFAAPSPNPARGSTSLHWTLSRAGAVRLALYDAAGRRARTLVAGTLEAGEHGATVALQDDAGHVLASGLYLVRLEAEDRVLTRRMVVIR